MLGGLAMRKSKGLSLALMLALCMIVIGQGWVIELGRCSCCSSSCPNKEKIEQSLWNREVYEFLYCDDCFQSLHPVTSTAPAPYEPANGTADYWLIKGNSSYLAGSYEQAEEAYAEALKLDPSLLEGWLNSGNALFFLGRYQESLDAYNAVLRLAPQDENALQGKSRVLSALNRTDESNSTGSNSSSRFNSTPRETKIIGLQE